MAKKFKVTVKFSGAAIIEVQADTVDAARREVAELDLRDIARVGFADIVQFELAAREITPSPAPGGSTDDEEQAPGRPRPSGWSLSG